MYGSEIFLDLVFVLRYSLVSNMQMFYYCYFIWKGLACFSRLYVLSPQSCPTFCDPMDCSLPGSSVHGHSPGKNTGGGCHALLQGIFLIQGLNSGLPHCRCVLYHLSHQGSPSILVWVAYPFSRGSSWPRNRTEISCIGGRFFTSWAIEETCKQC